MSVVIRKWGGLAGPAAVVAAGSMGAGSVAALILAGAWFRYELLWIVPLMLPLFVAGVDSSSRIGSVNRGQGLMSIVKARIHPGVAWLIVAINVPVHILVAMGQLSVMTSALLSLAGLEPGVPGATPVHSGQHATIEIVTSIGMAGIVCWIVLARGYERMQRVMTALMVAMFVCFLLIALRSFSESGAILRGFIPSMPEDVAAPGRNTIRDSSAALIAIVGSTIAPGSLLTMPYLSSDASHGPLDLKRDLSKSIVNLGLIFGAYSVFILVAGGFALYPLPNHAEIETVHEAGQVLTGALPSALSALGPAIFTVGLFIAAMTTLVVCVQLVIYLCLDILGKPWTFSGDNRLYRGLVIPVTLLIGVLAPVWSFPALLKVILIMGVNVLVVPLVIGTIIYLLNRQAVMGPHTAGSMRNVLLALSFALAIVLAVIQFPEYVAMFSALSG